MFEDLSPEEKSLAVRTKVRYAPHPYVWMSKARSNEMGLGLVSEGKELPLEELPEWEESKIKTLPMVSMNRSRDDLSFVRPEADPSRPTRNDAPSALEESQNGQTSLPSPSFRHSRTSHLPSPLWRYSHLLHPLSRRSSHYRSSPRKRSSL